MREQEICFSFPKLDRRHKRSNSGHYEGNFIPTNLTSKHQLKQSQTHIFIPSVHTTGFSPSVYRHETMDEVSSRGCLAFRKIEKPWSTEGEYLTHRAELSAHGGYRNMACVGGLLNTGYIDLDAVSTPDTKLKIPDTTNIAKMLEDKGLWHYVSQSASREAGKLRVLYSRGITVFMENSYNLSLNEWDLTTSEPSKVMAVDNFGRFVEITDNLHNVITYILTSELGVFRDLMVEAGINSSGLDETSVNAHMHSKHLTNTGSKKGEESWDMEPSTKPLIDWLEGAEYV